MNYFWKCIFFLASFSLLAPVFANVIYVDDNATTGGDGASWASAHKYLQDALAVAEYGDEIWVAEGTYKPDQGAGKTLGDREQWFILVNGVRYYGGFLGNEITRVPMGDANKTILSGEIVASTSLRTRRVLYGENLDGNTTIDGFQITKGNADANYANGNGAGIWLKNSTPLITNCLFFKNYAKHDGGAIYNEASSPTINNCQFLDNASSSGGSIYNLHSSSIIQGCFFDKGYARWGGAICNISSSVRLESCTFLEHTMPTQGAARYGSAIYDFNSTSTSILECYFKDNKGHRGTIYINSSDVLVAKCKFIGNNMKYGGGIYNFDSSPTIYNCVFSSNWGAVITQGGQD